ncbi:gliding motility protein GldB-related protein [Spirosoma gilvum]
MCKLYIFLSLLIGVFSCERILIRADQREAYEGRVNEPDAVYLSTYDADLFWETFQTAPSTSNPAEYYQEHYIDKGSVVLRRAFADGKVDGNRLNQTTTQVRSFYESIRLTAKQAVIQQQPAILASLRRLKTVYKDAQFPVVYFGVGAFSSGGKAYPQGVYIGLELFSNNDNMVINGINPYTANIMHKPSDLDVIVAHEMAHQQQEYRAEKTLLHAALQEGVAEFIAKLATGKVVTNSYVYTFGMAYEAAIWGSFKNDMMGQDITQWLYQGPRPNQYNYPTDMGYFVGYRIAEAYYNQLTDKQQAIYDMLHIQSATEFLKQSQYAKRF